MEVKEIAREEEETIHGDNRKMVDEDHQGEAQHKLARVEPIVEEEVANTPSGQYYPSN